MERFVVRSLTGPQLKALRQKREFTQAEVAKYIGCNLHTISYWDRMPGIISTRHGVPKRVAQALGIEVRSLSSPTWAKSATPPTVVRSSYDIPQASCDAQMEHGLPCQKSPEPSRSRCKQHGGLSPRSPNRIIEMAARIIAARQGAKAGGGGGASIQTAQMASARVTRPASQRRYPYRSTTSNDCIAACVGHRLQEHRTTSTHCD